MKLKKIPWKFDSGGGIFGCWIGDLIYRYFIWVKGRNGYFKVTVGINNREVGTYKTLLEAKKAAQKDLERIVNEAIE